MNKFSLIFSLFVSMSSFTGVYAQQPFIGELKCVPYTFTPGGWLECDGRLLNISDYESLFQLIGITYGGNGTTTFALPDLRARVPVGQGQSPGGSSVQLGEKGGSATVTLTTIQIPAHTHATQVSTSVATTNTPGTPGQPANIGLNPVKVYVETQKDITRSTPTAATGGNLPHDNMMPYMGMKWIIAVEGIFPTRN